jgi:hypothetical protein
METLKEWESIARLMIQIPSTCYKSDKSDKRPPSIPSKPPPPTKPDPLRPHEFPLTIITHRGKETDRTNFTHLQELWNGKEKPLEILTAGHRERNLTTQIK